MWATSDRPGVRMFDIQIYNDMLFCSGENLKCQQSFFPSSQWRMKHVNGEDRIYAYRLVICMHVRCGASNSWLMVCEWYVYGHSEWGSMCAYCFVPNTVSPTMRLNAIHTLHWKSKREKENIPTSLPFFFVFVFIYSTQSLAHHIPSPPSPTHISEAVMQSLFSSIR